MSKENLEDFFHNIFGEEVNFIPQNVASGEVKEDDKILFCKAIKEWTELYEKLNNLFLLGIDLSLLESDMAFIIEYFLEMTFKNKNIVNLVTWYIFERKNPIYFVNEEEIKHLRMFESKDDMTEIDISTPELFWNVIQKIISKGYNPSLESGSFIGDDEE